MDKSDLLRIARYNNLRGKNDYVITEDTYKIYYKKSLDRMRRMAKKQLPEDSYEEVWKLILDFMNVLRTKAADIYANRTGVLSRKNPLKDTKFYFIDIKQIYFVFVIEMFIRDDRTKELIEDKTVLNRYWLSNMDTPGERAYIDEVMKQSAINIKKSLEGNTDV